VAVEIFAKKEGWYEKSRYECKVSVIEGEVVTSMGIETVMVIEENCKRVRRMVWKDRTNELRIKNPMQLE